MCEQDKEKPEKVGGGWWVERLLASQSCMCVLMVNREVDNGLALCTQQLAGKSDKITSLLDDIIIPYTPCPRETSLCLFYFYMTSVHKNFTLNSRGSHIKDKIITGDNIIL